MNPAAISYFLYIMIPFVSLWNAYGFIEKIKLFAPSIVETSTILVNSQNPHQSLCALELKKVPRVCI